MHLVRYVKHTVWLLTACMLLSACAAGAPATQPTETPQDTAPTEVYESISEAVTEPTTEPVELSTEPTTEPAPEVYSINMQKLLEDQGVWVDVCQDGEVTACFYSCSFNIRLENLTPVENWDVSGISSWIRYYREDGTLEVTLYAGDIIKYAVDGNTAWLLDEEASSYDWLMEDMKWTIKELSEPIRMGYSGPADSVLQSYAEQNAGIAKMYGGASGEYQVLSATITEQSGSLVSGEVSFAVKGGYQLAGAGRSEVGTGEYEGWTIYHDSVVFERHSDGLWYEISPFDLQEWRSGGIGREGTLLPQTIARAEELLDSAPEAVAALGTAEQDLADLANLFLRCTTAASIAGKEDFDWSIFTTPDAHNHIGFQSVMMMKGGFFMLRFDSKFLPAVVRVDGDMAVVYDNDTHIYFRLVDGHWLIDDLYRPNSR